MKIDYEEITHHPRLVCTLLALEKDGVARVTFGAFF